jgi:hypothetical protein
MRYTVADVDERGLPKKGSGSMRRKLRSSRGRCGQLVLLSVTSLAEVMEERYLDLLLVLAVTDGPKSVVNV